MKELHPANRHPLNQRAADLLRQVGQSPQPNALYSAQLMLWSLERGQNDLREKFRGDVAGMVEQLLAGEPAKAHEWLMKGESEGEERMSPRDLDELSPREASNLLLESVHFKMQDQIPSYRLVTRD
jgi:hypothetical protein